MFATRAVFSWVLKVICVCFDFALLCSVIGWQKSRHFLNQWEEKPKPMASCTRTFSCAWCWLRVITSNSDWFTELSSPLVIGQSNCFGFGLRHSIANHSKIQTCIMVQYWCYSQLYSDLLITSFGEAKYTDGVIYTGVWLFQLSVFKESFDIQGYGFSRSHLCLTC